MNFGSETSFGFGNSGSGGGGGGGATTQFMWAVGGNSNFAAPPVAGDTTLTDPALAGKKVRVSRGGFWQLQVDPANGNTWCTKNLADNFVTFSSALANGEEMIVESFT